MVLSLLPGDQLPNFKLNWISIDSVVHFGMYFVLSISFLLGFLSFEKKINKKLNLSNLRLYGMVILAGILIGYTIELIQGNFIYRRYFDIADIVMNGFGTIFGVIMFSLTGRKLT
jgi:glycopeptide antibiotics resistance protein